MSRIPLYYKKGSNRNATGKRIEIRFPDPTANPYLAITALIYAGLDGIKRKLDPGDPLDSNAYHLSKAELERLGIRELPNSLWRAIEYLETDKYLRKSLGEELMEIYIEEKKKEYLDYSRHVTEWEYRKYFHL